MLQAFLQQLVPALEESIKLAVPLGILLAIILPLPDQSIRRTFTRVLKWGFFLSLFMTAVRVGTKSAVNREIFESMAITRATATFTICTGATMYRSHKTSQINAPKRCANDDDDAEQT